MWDSETLNELLRYEPETGHLYWRPRTKDMFTSDVSARRWNGRFAGKRALTALTHGHPSGVVDGKFYYAHRLIWEMEKGYVPTFIDHINGDRTDNRWKNLREVTKQQNQRNQKRRSDNSSGRVGVGKHGDAGKWRAYIQIHGRTKHLGLFDTFEEACAVREQAEQAQGYHPNHGREATALAQIGAHHG